MRTLDIHFNGTIAAWRCVLYHGKHINDFGSCRQLTASAFECVLRGATGDVVVVGGREWFQTAVKASTRDEICFACSINRL